MPLKCYNKPRRSERRFFKTCDAVRVCREVLSEDVLMTPEELLACIAQDLGFTHISLSRTRVVQSGLSVILAKRVALDVLIAALEGLATAISWLQRLIRNNPRLAKAIFVVEGFLKLKQAVERVVELFAEEPPDQARVEDVIDPAKCKCKRATPKPAKKPIVYKVKKE